MKKAERILCIIMTAVIIATAPMASYMEAHAVEVIALPLVEELLLSLGISHGFGAQNEFFSQLYENNLEDYFNAAVSGGTFTLPEYGTVDFSDGHSVLSLMDWCMKVNLSLLTGDPSHMDSPLDSIDAAYADAALKMDLVSYHNTGTSATNAMNDSISEFYDDYNGISEALAEDIRECFTVIKEGGKFNDDDASEEEKTARRKRFWKIFSAVTSAGMIGFGNTALPLAALKEYADSQFNEYDFDSIKDGFRGSLPRYSVSADPSFESLKSNYVLCSYNEPYGANIDTGYYLTGNVDYCGIDEGNSIRFYGYSSGALSAVYLIGRCVHGKSVTSSRSTVIAKSDLANFNGPLFSSVDDALNYFKTGDTSGVLNLNEVYCDFKQNVKGANSVVGNAFSNYVASLRSLSDIIDIIPGITEASDTYGGTAEALKAVSEILNRAASVPGTNPDPDVDDSSSSSGSYSGILGKILAAINSILTTTKSIPLTLVTLLAGKFMTADVLTSLLNGLPAMFSAAYSEVLNLALNPVITAFDALPLSLANALVEVFPAYDDALDAVLDLPKTLLEAVKGITITVPDIVIPEIVVPDILIPDIAIPDVFVDFPAITLDPTYEITVQDDYLVLGNVISDSVQGVLTDVFVPNKAVTLEKVGEMQEYFKFTEDMKEIVAEFEKSVFGITPSPILKIPIGKSKSKKYNYGLGNYIIIDVGWYAEYKDFGDKIILAFAWIFFIWRMFVLLPGIINGTVGGFFTPERVDRIIVDSEIKKDYAQLRGMRREYTTGGVYGRFSGGKFKD